MQTQSQDLLPSTMLFRFAMPAKRIQTLWSDKEFDLPDMCRVPAMSELDDKSRAFADVRIGWSPEGIAISVRVEGKKQKPWCRSTRFEDSDGFYLALDTRDVHDIHRASRFCHLFGFLPTGSGKQGEHPSVSMIPIQRAKEFPRPIPSDAIQIRSHIHSGGYSLRAMIPGTALTGFDPAEHPRLGFNYVVADREMGMQPFQGTMEFPLLSDPSLWGTLELR